MKLSCPCHSGIALSSTDGQTAALLMRNAELALVTAREQGTPGYGFYNPELAQDSRRRLNVQRAVAAANEQKTFRLDFQPVYNIRTGELNGFEALIRLHDAELGPISPCGVHSDRRAGRAHQRDRRLGAGRSLPRGRAMAPAPHGRRQPVALAVHVRHADPGCAPRAAEPLPAGIPPRSRDHRRHADERQRTGAGPAPRAARHGRRRCPRRLRHRILEPGLSLEVPLLEAQDRPQLRQRTRCLRHRPRAFSARS